ncbi:MAG: hypothetical protein Q7S00_05915 [bacterium]|nr:hypothetical protein [bacterium]
MASGTIRNQPSPGLLERLVNMFTGVNEAESSAKINNSDSIGRMKKQSQSMDRFEMASAPSLTLNSLESKKNSIPDSQRLAYLHYVSKLDKV